MSNLGSLTMTFKELDGGFATDQKMMAVTDGYSYDEDSDIEDDDLPDDATEVTASGSARKVCRTVPSMCHIVHSVRQYKDKELIAAYQDPVVLSTISPQANGIKHKIVIPDVAANTCVPMFSLPRDLTSQRKPKLAGRH